MLKSNLQLHSNVYLRDPDKRLIKDIRFINQVRGLKAISRLLDLLNVNRINRRRDDPEIERLVRQGMLTVAQQNSLEWGLPCVLCNSIPCGVTFDGRFEFRCDRPDCRKK